MGVNPNRSFRLVYIPRRAVTKKPSFTTNRRGCKLPKWTCSVRVAGAKSVEVRMDATEPLTVPFVIAVDSREKLPYSFQGLRADKRQHNRPLEIRTEWQPLRSGDYAILGLDHRFVVERKSLTDLFGTLGKGRQRFTAEMKRLAALSTAAVVVEASWHDVLCHPPELSRLNVKTIHRTVIAWQFKYPRVHWHFMGDRRLAEITTFRLLEKFYACGSYK